MALNAPPASSGVVDWRRKLADQARVNDEYDAD